MNPLKNIPNIFHFAHLTRIMMTKTWHSKILKKLMANHISDVFCFTVSIIVRYRLPGRFPVILSDSMIECLQTGSLYAQQWNLV